MDLTMPDGDDELAASTMDHSAVVATLSQLFRSQKGSGAKAKRIKKATPEPEAYEECMDELATKSTLSKASYKQRKCSVRFCRGIWDSCRHLRDLSMCRSEVPEDCQAERCPCWGTVESHYVGITRSDSTLTALLCELCLPVSTIQRQLNKVSHKPDYKPDKNRVICTTHFVEHFDFPIIGLGIPRQRIEAIFKKYGPEMPQMAETIDLNDFREGDPIRHRRKMFAWNLPTSVRDHLEHGNYYTSSEADEVAAYEEKKENELMEIQKKARERDGISWKWKEMCTVVAPRYRGKKVVPEDETTLVWRRICFPMTSSFVKCLVPSCSHLARFAAMVDKSRRMPGLDSFNFFQPPNVPSVIQRLFDVLKKADPNFCIPKALTITHMVCERHFVGNPSLYGELPQCNLNSKKVYVRVVRNNVPEPAQLIHCNLDGKSVMRVMRNEVPKSLPTRTCCSDLSETRDTVNRLRENADKLHAALVNLMTVCNIPIPIPQPTFSTSETDDETLCEVKRRRVEEEEEESEHTHTDSECSLEESFEDPSKCQCPDWLNVESVREAIRMDHCYCRSYGLTQHCDQGDEAVQPPAGVDLVIRENSSVKQLNLNMLFEQERERIVCGRKKEMELMDSSRCETVDHDCHQASVAQLAEQQDEGRLVVNRKRSKELISSIKNEVMDEEKLPLPMAELLERRNETIVHGQSPFDPCMMSVASSDKTVPKDRMDKSKFVGMNGVQVKEERP